MTEDTERDETISYAEARARLGVHAATLRRWLATGVVAGAPQPSGELRVLRASVERALAARLQAVRR